MITYGILANTAKKETLPVLAKLVTALMTRNATYLIHDEVAKAPGGNRSGIAGVVPGVPLAELLERATMVIALGGDGTILSAARAIGSRRLPILGINLGKLGFLAEVSVEEIERCLTDVEAGRYRVEERLALEARVGGGGGAPLTALNEIAIDRGASARVIDFETYVNGEYLVTYAADGIIVTTPTGSTGYSLATGGPIVTPKSDVLTIIAISPHTLTARPVIIPSDSEVRVSIAEGPTALHITADGQVETFSNAPLECVIRRAPYPVRLVRWSKGSYYDLLRAKLMWGRDLRTGTEKHR
jgi:NAD+ kinase